MKGITMELLSGIYMIHNIVNDKVYIGQSVDVKDRLSHHKSSLKHNRHENTYLQRSYNKYGEDAFEYKVQEYCSEDEQDNKERWYIEKYNATDPLYGYNHESGGSLNKHLSDAAKQRMSELRKGKYAGVNNPMYGKHLYWKNDTERVQRISEIMRKRNQEHPIKYSPSDEQKQHLAELFTGEGNPFYGKHHTATTKEKIRQTKTLRPVICVETQVIYESVSMAGNQTGIHKGSISRAARTHLTAGGYHWEFIV